MGYLPMLFSTEGCQFSAIPTGILQGWLQSAFHLQTKIREIAFILKLCCNPFVAAVLGHPA